MLTREGEREVAPCFWYGRMHPKRPLVTSPFRRPYEQYREHQEPGGAIYGFGLEGGGVLWFFNPRSYPPPRLFDALPGVRSGADKEVRASSAQGIAWYLRPLVSGLRRRLRICHAHRSRAVAFCAESDRGEGSSELTEVGPEEPEGPGAPRVSTALTWQLLLTTPLRPFSCSLFVETPASWCQRKFPVRLCLSCVSESVKFRGSLASVVTGLCVPGLGYSGLFQAGLLTGLRVSF